MKKLILFIITLTVLAMVYTIPIKAEIYEAAGSAMPKFRSQADETFDYREYTLRKFLTKYNSPLTPFSLEFIKTADYYGVDWRFVPAIAGVESTFGKRIPTNSYNAYGWANGNYSFDSWPDSIVVVNKTLKERYIDKGAVSINKIARIYAPPSTTWGNKVKYFMGKINILPLTFDI